MKLLDLTGQQFERWTALYRDADKKSVTFWVCRCQCGTVKSVQAHNLITNASKSCGCLRREVLSALHKKHGFSPRGKPYPEYRVWQNMLQRCTNPKATQYKHYGGRGIKVCERWLTFSNFLTDMGTRPTTKHSLDRKEVDGDYEATNCQWSTKKEQEANKRVRKVIDQFTNLELIEECKKRGLLDLRAGF